MVRIYRKPVRALPQGGRKAVKVPVLREPWCGSERGIGQQAEGLP